MLKKKSLLSILLLLLSMLLPFAAAAEWEILLFPSVPVAAKEIASDLDKQIEAKYVEPHFTKGDITIVSTVPVALDNFDESNLLSLQFAEEVSTLLVEYGYKVNEIRKGDTLYIEPRTGEFLLTREYSELVKNETDSIAVLVGTYVVTSERVRYNMSLLHVPSNEVLAKAAATIKITEEILPLIYESPKDMKLRPNVQTKLP